MTKKFLSLLLAIVMICAMGAIPVSAVDPITEVVVDADGELENVIVDMTNNPANYGSTVTIKLGADIKLAGVTPFDDKSYVEALYYLGSKNIILDLNGCDITMGSAVNEYGFYFRNNDTSTENEISFVNSKWNTDVSVITGGDVYGIITVNHHTADCGKTTLYIDKGVTVQDKENKAYRKESAVVMIRKNAVGEILSGATIIAKGSTYGTNALLQGTSVVNIYGGATIIHKGSTGIAVMGQGTSNIYGGKITAENNVHAVQPASTGEGVINISGGNITAASNAVYLDAAYDKDGTTKISVNITGGTIEGNLVTNVNTTNPQNAAAINIAKNPETGVAPVITGNITVSENGSIAISGGTVDGKVEAQAGSSATISGGTIKGALTAAKEDLTVTGGTFEDEDAQELVKDLIAGDNSNGNFEILDGVVRHKIPDRSRVSFVADGRLVGIILYRANQDELTALPNVPAKEGYVGTWAEYTLTGKNMIVRAVYTPIAE